MKKRNTNRPRSSYKKPNANFGVELKFICIGIVCLFFVVGSFFAVAIQHFSSVNVNIDNSTLRRQLDELESENRKLVLDREMALSPSELTKTAQKLGFVTLTAAAAVEKIDESKKVTDKATASVTEKVKNENAKIVDKNNATKSDQKKPTVTVSKNDSPKAKKDKDNSVKS